MCPPELLGRWRLLRAHHSLDFAPEAGMRFMEGGRLEYSFAVGEERHVIPLIYQVDGDQLRTDNPAAPHATSVRWRIGAGDILLLDFAGAEACFVREGDTGKDGGPRAGGGEEEGGGAR